MSSQYYDPAQVAAATSQLALIKAAIAEDAAKFYSEHPEVQGEDREKVEEALNHLLQTTGQTFRRADLYAWHIGNGTITPRSGAASSQKGVEQMTQDELSKALEGVEF